MIDIARTAINGPNKTKKSGFRLVLFYRDVCRTMVLKEQKLQQKNYKQINAYNNRENLS